MIRTINMKALSEQHIDHVLSLLKQNKKLEAVKFVVEQSNLGLKEAKDWVELLMDNPDAAPYSANLTPFTQNSTPRKMTTVQNHYSSKQVFIKYNNGDKVEIDEQHPEWIAAMKMFGRGTIYNTKHDYLQAMQQASDEMFNQADHTHSDLKHSNPVHKVSQNLTSNSVSSLGVEDLSKKKNTTNLVALLAAILFIIVMIAYFIQ